MKKPIILATFFFTLSTTVFAQNFKLSGIVTDEKDSAMIGVTVVVKGTSNGTQTDTAGRYSLDVEQGTHTIEFSYIGYTTRTILVTNLDGKDRKEDVKMTEESKQLDIVVVTGAGEKKLGEEVTTVEVLKADVIEQSNAKFDEAMNKVPGVNMMGRSISIRGGSGFADATSNRVLALQDGLPIISPENGGIIWDMVPIEELDQVEVIKGSASSLFGSSALDGVLNLVTVNPEPTMENKVLISYGLYDQPSNPNEDWWAQHTPKLFKFLYGTNQNKEWDWWWNRKIIKGNGDTVNKLQPRMFGGGQFLHRKQYGDVGIVISAAYQQDQSYLQDNDMTLARFGAKIRYIPHKNPHITTGLNMNFFYKNYHDFFIASDTGKGMYQSGLTPPTVRQRTFNIDPYFTMYDDHDNRHQLKARIFNVLYNSTTGDSTTTTELLLDYNFQHNFRKAGVVVTTGATLMYTLVRGKTFEAPDTTPLALPYYTTRHNASASAFLQFEKKFFKRLTLVAGIRAEWSKLSDTTTENQLPLINAINSAAGGKNTINSPITPIGRIGLVYQATEGTSIRGSFGQGYRYPSLAEKYVYTFRSGALVFPNDSLKPENGWMAEVGVNQGVKISKWVASFNVSAFIMRYHNLIEFEVYEQAYSNPQYDNILNLTNAIPFKAENIDNARIPGCEVSALGTGKIFGIPLNFLIGYTYIYPQNLSYNPSDPTSTPLLKYRTQHTVKADIQANFKGAVLGISAFYGSNVKYIDNSGVGALVAVQAFRETHDEGEFVMDLRAGYNYKDKATFMFICKNVLNTEYMLQPGVIDPPRNYTFQIGYNF